jgi:hypothetical protein
LAILLRTDSAILVWPFIGLAVWFASGRTARAAIRLTLGAGPAVVVWAVYNHVRYGAPWRLGYQVEGAGFFTPFGTGFIGLTISPGRGLIWYAPIVAVALLGMRWAWRRDALVVVTAASLVVARVLLYSRWWAWEGGVCWGPRFLVPGMGMYAVGVLEVVRRRSFFSRWTRAGVVVVSAVSVGVQLVGAAVRYEAHFNDVAVPRAVGPERRVDFYYFDWSESPIIGEAEYLSRGHQLTGRFLFPAGQSGAVVGLVLVTAIAFTVAFVAASSEAATDRSAVPEAGHRRRTPPVRRARIRS